MASGSGEAEGPDRESSVKRALAVAARRTKAAADAATQRAAKAVGQEVDQGEMDEIIAARRNAAVKQASEIAAEYSPVKTTREAVPVPTGQAEVQPGISPHCTAPAPVNAPLPVPIPSVDRRVACQKFLYDVANQTAMTAKAQMAVAEDLSAISEAREEARDKATKARKNMALARKMANAAQSPNSAAQAVDAIRKLGRER